MNQHLLIDSSEIAYADRRDVHKHDNSNSVNNDLLVHIECQRRRNCRYHIDHRLKDFIWGI